MHRAWKWINDRIPVAKVLQIGLDEEIIGGSSFFYTLGSATLFVFTLQMVTGIWQLFYYVPTVDHAYDSLNFFRLFVPYGWLIHGLHYWGATAMVILVGLHILRVFIWGAYKQPRELTWTFGVVLLLLTITMSFTGAALPWDERGYWATVVGTSIAGTTPVIGTGIKFLLIGGSKIGQLTLSRFFILHTAIIPIIALVFITFHIAAFRKFGSVGPWKEERRKTISDFWPEQVTKDIIVGVLIFLLLVTLAAFSPPPFTGPADPLDTTFAPKPEWNFLFLYQALKLFPGSLEKLGTVGIPALVLLLFILLPFLDRKANRNPARRPFMMLGGMFFLGLLFTLTWMGYTSGEKKSENETYSKVKTEAVKVKKLSPAALRGQNIYNTYGCMSCHTISGSGGKVGPDLTNESQKGHSKNWIIAQVTNPRSHNPQSPMPPFSMLDTTQLSDLADYLLSPHPQSAGTGTRKAAATESVPASIKNENSELPEESNAADAGNNESETGGKTKSTTGPAAEMIGNVVHGALLFGRDCESCHGTDGKGGVPNPGSLSGQVPALNPISRKLFSKNPQTFADNIDRIIQNGSVPQGQSPQLKMEDYGKSHALTQQEIANIEAYISDLNGVNRAEIQITSFSPEEYYIVVASAFAVISILFVFLWYTKQKKE